MPLEATAVLTGVPAILNGGFQVAQTSFALQQVPKEIGEQFRTIEAIKTDIIKAKERRIAAAKNPNPPDLLEWDRVIREVEDALKALERLTEPARLDMKHNKGKIKKSTRLAWVLRDSKSVAATNNRLAQASSRMGFTTMSHTQSHLQISAQVSHSHYHQHQTVDEVPPPYHEDTKKAINERRKEEYERISRSPSLSPPMSPPLSPPMSPLMSPPMSPSMNTRSSSPSPSTLRPRFNSDPEPQSISGRLSSGYESILPTSQVAELVPPSPTQLRRYVSTPAAPTLSSRLSAEDLIPHSHSTTAIPAGTQGSVVSGWDPHITDAPSRQGTITANTDRPPVQESTADVDALTMALTKLNKSKAKRAAKSPKIPSPPPPESISEGDMYDADYQQPPSQPFSPDDIGAPSSYTPSTYAPSAPSDYLPTTRRPPSPPISPPSRSYGISTAAPRAPTREQRAPNPPYPVSRGPTKKEYFPPSSVSSSTTNPSQRHISPSPLQNYELSSSFNLPSNLNPFRDPSPTPPRIVKSSTSSTADGVTTTHRALAGHRHPVSLRYKPFHDDSASSRPPSFQIMGSPPPSKPPSQWGSASVRSIDEGDNLETEYLPYKAWR